MRRQTQKATQNQFISLAKSKHYLLISKNYCIFVSLFAKKGGLRINGTKMGINRRAMHAIGYVKVFVWKALQKKCEDLRKVVEDVVGFGDGEFLTDLSLTLVNSLKTLTSEHVNLRCRKICLKQKHK